MAKTESLQLKKRIPAFILMLIILFSSVISVAAYSRTAVINDNGTQQEMYTTEVYTDTILNTAEIQLGEDDQIIRTDENGVIKIKILRAFKVTIQNEGETFDIKIASGTVADALSKAGISYSGEDNITPDVTEVLKPNMLISINNNVSVIIKVDNQESEYFVPRGNVEQALIASRIEYSEDDIIEPSPDTAVSENLYISISRVKYEEEVKGETIAFKETEKKTDKLQKGKTKIDTYGVEGYKEIVTTKKYVDGKLVDTIKTEEIIDKPVTQVLLVGTKEAESTTTETPKVNSNSGSNFYKDGNGTFTDADGKKVKYTAKYEGSGTAYTANQGALTASGIPVYVGGVAVNPAVIPLGSKLYIVSNDGSYIYGYATAIDTGGALYAGDALVDLFYWSESECINFGRRQVTVYVLG